MANFKLRQMEVFRAVMLTGSASGAARMLFVSQPVVSRSLAHIEASIGLQLFERKGGALSPTENARIIFREIEGIYDSAQQIDELIANLKTEKPRKISFCTSPALGIQVIPKAIFKYREKYPEMRFSYRTALIKDMPMDLLGKTADFALSIWQVEHPNLECTPLFEGQIALIVPRGHALARQGTVSLQQLAGVPLILYEKTMPIGVSIRQALAAVGVEASPVVEINRSELACSLVHQGVGVALVNRYGVDEDIWHGLVVKDIDVEIPASVWLLHSRFEPLSEDCRLFVHSIRDEYQA